jgi:hypothetical protein
MFDKIRNSWALVMDSAAVLRADRELIVFPLISAVLELVVGLCFFLPSLMAGLFGSLVGGGAGGIGLLVGLSFLGVQSYVNIFTKSALVGAAMIRLRGGDPTIADGVRAVSDHAGPIFAFALLQGFAGTVLRWLAKRGKTLQQFGAAIGGLAWEMATYLALPVLVVEDAGPIEAITRSATLLKKTWGEQLAGHLGVGAVFGLFKLLIVALVVLAHLAGLTSASTAVLAIVVALAGLSWIAVSLIESTLNGIYVAAVYRYAAEGEPGGFFDEVLVKGAFKAK